MEIVVAEIQKSLNLKKLKSRELEEDLFERKVEIKNLKRKLSKLAPEIEESERTIKHLKEKIDEGKKKKKLRSMKEKLKESKEELVESSKIIEDLKKEEESKDKIIKLLSSRTEDLNGNLSKEEMKSYHLYFTELERLKKEEKEQEEEITSLKSSLNKSRALSEELESEAKLLSERFERLSRNNARLERSIVEHMRETRNKEEYIVTCAGYAAKFNLYEFHSGCIGQSITFENEKMTPNQFEKKVSNMRKYKRSMKIDGDTLEMFIEKINIQNPTRKRICELQKCHHFDFLDPEDATDLDV